MKSIFRDDSWTEQQAIVRICFGVVDDAVSEFKPTTSKVGVWLCDPRKKLKCGTQEQIGRVNLFHRRLNDDHDVNIKQIEMHPVLWAWFAMSEVRDAVDPAFRSKLERWFARSLLACNMPVMWRVLTSGNQPSIKLNEGSLKPETGVPAMTLVSRQFDSAVFSQNWCLTMHPFGQRNSTAPTRRVSRGKNETKQIANGGTTAGRSQGCERVLCVALKKMAERRNSPVKKLKGSIAGAGGRLYFAPSLDQGELLELIQKRYKSLATHEYAPSTLKRSLSCVAVTRRGRRPGTTKALKLTRNRKLRQQ